MGKTSRDLTKDDVVHLAKLSKLELTDEELDKIESQLNETLAFVENLNELSTDDVPSENQHVTKTTNVYAEDEVETSAMLTQTQALQNAPQKKHNYFVVKRIL